MVVAFNQKVARVPQDVAELAALVWKKKKKKKDIKYCSSVSHMVK